MSVHHLRKVSALLFTSALLFGAAGFGIVSGSSDVASATTKPDTIIISNFMFSPMIIKVAPDATIKVTNKDAVDHKILATDEKFHTPNIAPNQTKSFKAPMKAGKYHYFCSFHTFMKGTIIVK